MARAMMDFVVDKMKDEDWNAVQSIYCEGIATGNATFETNVPEWEDWDRNHLRDCRLAARKGEQVIGWAALSPVSGRCVYAGVAEVSVYVAASARGKGAGKALLRALVEESERQGIWTLQAGIFPENEVSIALHKACGFREVGRRERIGRMKDAWRDVVLLERRSTVVGVPNERSRS
jgi:L-amino acid N-acyltransferase YncA